MDSLSRAALTHGIPLTPFTSNRTPPSQSPMGLNLCLLSNSQTRVGGRVFSKLNPENERNPIVQKIKTTTGSLILTVATALMIGKLSDLPARAESPVSMVVEEEKHREEGQQEGELQGEVFEVKKEIPLEFMVESQSEGLEGLEALLEGKLESGEVDEALKILKNLGSDQSVELEWKIFVAGLLSEMGEKAEARKVYEEILIVNPLCFDALFQNSVLMDLCGQGQAALSQLEESLKLAQGEEKVREVRLISAQIQYLQKNVDEALKSYEELAKQDPKDYRSYFYQFVIYSLLDKKEEAKAQLVKCQEVEGFSQTPISRMKLFGSDTDN